MKKGRYGSMTLQENKEFMNMIENHPIFSGASAAEFRSLLDRCDLKAYRKNEKVLYSKSPREGLLLILEGITEVCVQTGTSRENREVLEVLEAGEMVGFSSLADFLGEPNPHEDSVTVEVHSLGPSVCLHIPYEVLESRWHDEDVREYVLRQVAVRLREIYSSLAEQVKLANQWGESDPFIRRAQDLMNEPALTINQDTPVDEVARTMVEAGTSSILVTGKEEELLGIITEKDLVQRVVSAGAGKTKTAGETATLELVTIHRHAYYYEAMSSFLTHRVKHLPVVDDNRRPVGMVTLSDLLRKKNRGQFNIIQEIESSNAETLPDVKHAIYSVLGNLIQDGMPAFHIMEAITTLYDRLVYHCVEMAAEEVRKEHGEAPVAFAFFLMGSAGRREQFLLTDQDHFLVYDDPEEGGEEKVDTYFKTLGEKITSWMEHAGYKLCDGGMMASFPAWRGNLSAWKKRLRSWGLRATNENILLGHNFLSFRFLYGDERLHDRFTGLVADQLEKSRIFLYRAAEEEKQNPVPTLDQPIRALFRMKKETIDIKLNVLFPFHHSLQILSAKYGMIEGTPKQQIERLTEEKVFSEKFADELQFAYEVILHIRVSQAWKAHLQGEKASSKIYFRKMKTRDKEELMLALKTIRSLQNQLASSYGMP